jgi:hypothetical protein
MLLKNEPIAQINPALKPQTASLLRRTLVGVFLGIIFAFYLWTAGSSGPVTEYYNWLTDAFLAGQLSLLAEPSEELLNLPDPYNPSLNQQLRLHDAILYDNKYYIYWGPAPALTLFMPYYLIFGRNLPENIAAALFCFGGLMWSVLLLQFLAETYFTKRPFWMRFVAILCLSFSNVAPFILRRPAVYEVAISSGYFFLLGSLYWLLSGGLQSKGQPWRLLLGSLFLGLAVGSRPHLVFAAIFPLLLWLKSLKEQNRVTHPREALIDGLYLSGPFLACIGLLGLYNHLRFDSWTEFGSRFQLAAIYMPTHRFFGLSRILPGLYFYFLAPAQISLEFPFFHLAPSYPWPLPEGYYSPEAVAGVLANIPFINILFLSPLVLVSPKRLSGSKPYLGLTLTFFILLALALVFLVSAVFASATMRYEVDFVSLLLLPSILLWFYFDERFGSRKFVRLITRTFSLVLIVYGCLFNGAISLTGYHGLLKGRHPETYESIEKAFLPLQQTAAKYLASDYGSIALKIRLPYPLPQTPEPLVVTGRTGAGDFALVKYLDHNSIAFGFDHWGRGGPVSAPIRVLPGEVYDLEISMGSLYPGSGSTFSLIYPKANSDEVRNLCLIKFNGTEVLRESVNFYPSDKSDVTIGENKIGGGICGRYFSGTIIALNRIPPR